MTPLKSLLILTAFGLCVTAGLAQAQTKLSGTFSASAACPAKQAIKGDKNPGNVQTEAWDAMQTSTVYRRFAAVKSQWNASCDACPWLRFCHGDCPKNRPGHIPGALSHLCDGWRRFYAHAVPRLLPFAEEIRRGRAESR